MVCGRIKEDAEIKYTLKFLYPTHKAHTNWEKNRSAIPSGDMAHFFGFAGILGFASKAEFPDHGGFVHSPLPRRLEGFIDLETA